MSSDMQTFEFNGSRFPLIPMADGDSGVPLRRMTECLGIDFSAQRQMIERSAWSEGRMGVIPMQLPGDVQSRDHFIVSHRIVPMWLANIESSRIKSEAARDRVIFWQREFADALYQYVFNGGAINPAATPEQIEGIYGELRHIRVSVKNFAMAFNGALKNQATDYDPNSLKTQEFYRSVTNKIYVAVTGMTAGEIIESRSVDQAPTYGLTSWTGKRGPSKKDRGIARNYLTENEMEVLERSFNAFLDFMGGLQSRGVAFTFDQWNRKLDQWISVVLHNDDLGIPRSYA